VVSRFLRDARVGTGIHVAAQQMTALGPGADVTYGWDLSVRGKRYCLSPDDVQNITNNKLFLYVFGETRYHDIFNRPRKTTGRLPIRSPASLARKCGTPTCGTTSLSRTPTACAFRYLSEETFPIRNAYSATFGNLPERCSSSHRLTHVSWKGPIVSFGPPGSLVWRERSPWPVTT